MLKMEELKSIIMLSDLNDTMLKKMLKVTKKTNYSSGEYIFKEGEYAEYWKPFYVGISYAIVAYTDDPGVQDIDVYLYDTDGSVLVKDTEQATFAIVYYRPYVSRRMRVVIENYDSSSKYRSYNCKFIILYSNQIKIALSLAN